MKDNLDHHRPWQQNTVISGDAIIKLVRANYRPLAPHPYHHEYIQCRNNTTCQKSKPEDYWTTNFKRRRINLERGFYSLPTEPYRPIGGELILEPFDLVLSKLPTTLDKKAHPQLRRGSVKIEQQDEVDNEQSVQEASITSFHLSDTSPTAGFADIKRLLQETTDRMVSVRAGMPYGDHVKTVEAKYQQGRLKDDGEMVIQSVSSCFLHTVQPVDSGVSVCSGSSDESSQSNSTVGQSKLLSVHDNIRELPRRMSARRMSARKMSERKSKTNVRHEVLINFKPVRKSRINLRVGSAHSLLYQKKDRQFRDQLMFLRSVYNLLTAIHNMRMRDLRSKVPLGKDVLEKYQRDEATRRENAKECTLAPIGMTKARVNVSSNMETDVVDALPAPPASMFGSMAKKINIMESTQKQFGKSRRNRVSASHDPNRPVLETWDDLLNVQRQEYKEDPKSPIFTMVVAKFLRWYKVSSIIPAIPVCQDPNERPESHRGDSAMSRAPTGSVQTDKAKQRLPIWQQVAQEKSTVFIDHRNTDNSGSKEPNVEQTIQRIRQNINEVRKSVEKENTAEMEKMSRERVANFRLKFGSLDPSERSVLFEQQRARIRDIKDTVDKTQLQVFDIQPNKWYEVLKTSTLGVKDQPYIQEVMDKLNVYSHMDNKTLTFGKARLCLLMMSMPAYEICQIYVQQALKFIFVEILLGQESQFIEWLNYRKIPCVLMSNLEDTTTRTTAQNGK